MWPPAALEFLRELESNNDREWFRANRSRYDEYLLAPTRELAGKLSAFGKPRFFRPYRDTRFRPGPPIREEISLGFGLDTVGGYYVSLSLDGLLVGAGLHHPTPDQLARFRAAVDDLRLGTALERAITAAQAAGMRPIAPSLKRAPKGYAVDHPRIDRLRMKRLTVFRRYELGRWLHTDECDKRIHSAFVASRPLVNWLSQTVGPPLPAPQKARV